MIGLMLLWTGVAAASSCCATGGVAPTALASCDRLGVALGLGGDLETGGWAWGGAWSGVGDDGGGTGSASVSALARATPWLQLGLRLPLQLTVDRLDGEREAGLGLGELGGWVIVEAPPGWPGPRAPQVGLELGLRSARAEGIEQAQPLRASAGARLASAPATWGAWGLASAEVPLTGDGPPSLAAALTVDRALRPRARLGLAATARVTPGALRALETAVGPELTLAPSLSDRLTLSALIGPPVSGAGWNAPSSLQVRVDWLNVIRPYPSGA